MVIDDTLDKLEIAKDLSRYYYDGILGDIFAISFCAEAYLRSDGEEKVHKEKSLELLKGIEEHYSRLPGGEVSIQSHLYPVAMMRSSLHVFRDYVDRIFENQEDVLDELRGVQKKIAVETYFYRDNLQRALRDIRSHPDYKDYTIMIEGPDGTTWDICDLACV